jgi:hypothetical protein
MRNDARRHPARFFLYLLTHLGLPIRSADMILPEREAAANVRKIAPMRLVLALILTCGVGVALLFWPTVKRKMEIGVDPTDRHAVAVLDRSEWDFGPVLSGPTLRAKFPVKNVGEHRLILRQEVSSCECVAGDQPTLILEPGESTEITATMDTRELNGAFQMELSYTTSAPNLPKFKLTLLADVHRSLQSNAPTE